jgi:hypothetical protein
MVVNDSAGHDVSKLRDEEKVGDDQWSML